MGSNARTSSVTNSRELKLIDRGFCFAWKACDVEILSLRHLVTMIEDLKQREIGFRSICDVIIDTTTPSGELIFHVFSALAQFERRLIQERTKAGLAAVIG